MEQKYKLKNIFIGPVNRIVDDYVDKFEYKTLYERIFITDDKNGYTDLLLSDYIYSYDRNANLKVDSKFVFEKDIMPFQDYLKITGVNNNKKSLNINEILKLHVASKKQEQQLENTLAIIKPDGMLYIEEIIEMFYENDLKIKDFKVEQLNEEEIAELYAHLLDKPFYHKLRDYMMGMPVAIMVLEGENALEKLKKIMGPNDLSKAPANTIRGKFGDNAIYDVIHGSVSKKNAEVEIKRFFKQKQKVK